MKKNAIAIGHKYMPQSLAWFEKNYIKTKRNKPPPNQPKQIKNWSTQALSPSQQIPDGPAAALYSMGTHFSLCQGDTGLLPLAAGRHFKGHHFPDTIWREEPLQKCRLQSLSRFQAENHTKLNKWFSSQEGSPILYQSNAQVKYPLQYLSFKDDFPRERT